MIKIKNNIYEENYQIKKNYLFFLNLKNSNIFKILKKVCKNIFYYFLLFFIVCILIFLNFYVISKKLNLKSQLNGQKLKKKGFYSKKIINLRAPKEVELDNEINISLYENNIDFSNYSSKIKVIALYLPIFFKHNYNISNKSSEWEDIIKVKPLYKEHHQPRKPGDDKNYLGYYDLTNPEVIKKQVKLARNHGIYGFGIYFYWNYDKILFEKPIKIYLENKDINFPFLLIWRNNYIETKNHFKNTNITEKRKYNVNEVKKFTKDIKKYIIDPRYIKIKGKSVLGIYEPLKIIELKNMILKCRIEARKIGIGELFILANLNEEKFEIFKNMKIFNGVYEFPPKSIEKKKLKKNKNYYFYSGLIYRRNKKLDNLKDNFLIFRGNMIEWDNSSKSKDYFIFGEFSPERFYIMNKLILDWTKNYHNENNQFIFVNSWNNWIEGTYLEPDEKYGYASINSLSKALFNLPFRLNNFNFSNIININRIAIHAHVYYEDLILEIINKTNNIPVKFDLYITTTSLEKYNIIKKNVKKFSNSYKYYIKIVDNRGRDILPLLIQLKNNIKKYKYICHIHSKKTTFSYNGEKWRKYLYENLLGNNDIVSEILNDFENYNKLGFIFPETFYPLSEAAMILRKKDKKYLNFILNKIFPGYKIGKKLDFPAGDMFWAKVNSIYNIFELKNFEKLFPKESNQHSGTIMHGIERVWLYLVKLNGYYYKKIFKHF